MDWDNGLVDRIKAYGGKVVFFIQDVPPIQFENNYFLMPYFIDMYNKAELVIVPSERMYQRLVEEGLTVKKYVVQKMWDFNVHMDLHTPSFERKLYFLGDVSRFPFSRIGNMIHLFMPLVTIIQIMIILKYILVDG